MPLPELIRRGEKTAVDFDQIKKIVSPHGVDVTFVEHKDLPAHPSLSTILGSHTACCVLMEVKHSSQPIRHWVLVIGKPHLVYFDSLALSLEHMYQITKSEPKLIRAFKGLKVDMPHVRIQKNLSNVRDCGLHCSVRAVFHKYSNKEYYKFLKSFGSDTDATVVMMCLLHLVDMKSLTIK